MKTQAIGGKTEGAMDKFETAEHKRQKTLRYLRKNPGARVGAVAAMLQMPKSNVHKMLCGMATTCRTERRCA